VAIDVAIRFLVGVALVAKAEERTLRERSPRVFLELVRNGLIAGRIDCVVAADRTNHSVETFQH
jgi:hypothetical protein